MDLFSRPSAANLWVFPDPAAPQSCSNPSAPKLDFRHFAESPA